MKQETAALVIERGEDIVAGESRGANPGVPSECDKAPAEVAVRSRAYPWVLLAILSMTYLLSSLDRMVINLLVEPIKADFGLTDTEVSILVGPAFIAVFSLAIIPMGYLVDRISRTRLLAAGLGFWSIMTGLCGMAGGFASLALARAGVGLGEATLNPSGYSLISDAFDKRRLGFAVGIFIMGGALGAGVAFLLGGVVIGQLADHGNFALPILGEMRPWQLTFVLLTIPGIVLSVILGLMPNPARKTSKAALHDPASEGALKAYYRRNAGLLARHHFAMGAANMVQLGTLGWIAPLLARVHGWDSSEIGLVVGLVLLIILPAGLIIGGYIGDYAARRGAQQRLVICAWSLVLAAIAGVIYPVLADPWWLVAVFAVASFFAAIPPGIGNAALQYIVPGEIRGRVSAIYYLIALVIGMAGPTSVALASDFLFPSETGIRYALMLVIPATMLVAAVLFVWCLRPYKMLAEQMDHAEPVVGGHG